MFNQTNPSNSQNTDRSIFGQTCLEPSGFSSPPQPKKKQEEKKDGAQTQLQQSQQGKEISSLQKDSEKIVEKKLLELQDFVINQQKVTQDNSATIKTIEMRQSTTDNNISLHHIQLQQLQNEVENVKSQYGKVIEMMANEIKMQNHKIDALTNYNNLLIHSMNALHRLSQPSVKKQPPKHQPEFFERKSEKFISHFNREDQPKKELINPFSQSQVNPVSPSYNTFSQSQVYQGKNSSVYNFNEPKAPQSVRNASQSSKGKNFFKKKSKKTEKHGDYYLTYEEGATLFSVSNVTVENRYGKIIFEEPINLMDKVIEECVQIEPNSADIVEQQWQEKNCRVIVFNYKNYLNVDDLVQKATIKKEVIEEASGNNMLEFEKIDERTGDLYLRMIYK